MFEKSLTEKLKAIFDLDKVTFDTPGESREQECIFVEVESVPFSVRDGIAYARAVGTLTIFGSNDKMPFGYFAKHIQGVDRSLTKDFFFGPEQNQNRYRNIVERSMSFVYFFNGQYNPATGKIINDITFTE